MIIVAGTLRIPEETIDELEPFARATLEASRRDPGCITYSYAFDLEDRGLLRIFERWASRADLDNHLAQPHMRPWREELARVGASDRKLAVYEADSGEPI